MAIDGKPRESMWNYYEMGSVLDGIGRMPTGVKVQVNVRALELFDFNQDSGKQCVGKGKGRRGRGRDFGDVGQEERHGAKAIGVSRRIDLPFCL